MGEEFLPLQRGHQACFCGRFGIDHNVMQSSMESPLWHAVSPFGEALSTAGITHGFTPQESPAVVPRAAAVQA